MATSIAEPAVFSDSTKDELKEKIGPALGRIPSGVYILTMRTNREKHGVLATWVAQAGFYPPKVTVALNKERTILSNFVAGAFFTINVLSPKNMDVFKNFAAPAALGIDRFDGLNLAEPWTASGPVFSDAVAFLDCRVDCIVDAGDHSIVLAEVIAGRILNEESPMTHLRKNGFGY